MQKRLTQLVDSARVAGLQVAIINDNKIVWTSSFGFKDIENQQMLSTQIPVTSKRGFGPLRDSLTHENDAIKLAWGSGVGLFQSPSGKAFFHIGHGDANQNYAVAFPEKGIAVVLLSNSENFESVSGQIVEACIGDSYSPLRWLGHLDH